MMWLKLLNIRNILIVSCIILISTVFTQQCSIKRLKSQKEDLSSLVDHFQSESKTFKDKQGRSHIQSSTIIVNSTNSLKNDSTVKEALKKVNQPLRKLEMVSVSNSKTELAFKPVVKDSVVIRDSVRTVLHCLTYSNKFITAYGCLEDSLHFISIDTLTTVIFKQRKHKILFFRVGKMLYTTEVVSSNPYTNIVGNKTIIKRK